MQSPLKRAGGPAGPPYVSPARPACLPAASADPILNHEKLSPDRLPSFVHGSIPLRSRRRQRILPAGNRPGLLRAGQSHRRGGPFLPYRPRRRGLPARSPCQSQSGPRPRAQAQSTSQNCQRANFSGHGQPEHPCFLFWLSLHRALPPLMPARSERRPCRQDRFGRRRPARLQMLRRAPHRRFARLFYPISISCRPFRSRRSSGRHTMAWPATSPGKRIAHRRLRRHMARGRRPFSRLSAADLHDALKSSAAQDAHMPAAYRNSLIVGRMLNRLRFRLAAYDG